LAQRSDVPGKPLTFVIQAPDLFQLDLRQRGPAAEEDGKAVITSFPSAPKAFSVKH
jgi:hypothetical protein